MNYTRIKINNSENKNLKICIVRHAYFPDDSTIRKEVFALLEGGYSVDIICLRKHGQAFRENIRGARVFRIPLSHKRAGIFRYLAEYALSFIMMSIVLSCLFVKNRYRCIQVNTIPDFLIFTTIIPKLLGSKILLHLHEPTPELWLTKYGSNRLNILLWLQINIEKLAIKYADCSLTVTNALRLRFGERGANIDTITVIPNVCEEVFYDDPYIKRTVPDGGFRLVTHGLIEERYGHELIVKAVNSLRERLPDIRFDILGDGEYKETLARFVQELGCEDKVHFLGFVSFSYLLQKLREADVGIIAMNRSPYSELVDTQKMYEYMSLKKPVILSRLPAVEENFDDSCVMFFDPGNHEDLACCILELYHNPEKRRELAENAYSRYEKVRWSKTKKIYLKIIENLIREE